MGRPSYRAAMYRERVGLPATPEPGRAVVALCHWQDFNYGERKPGDPLWLERAEPPTACRASMGAEKLNVWLPQGARVVIRAVRWYREKGIDPVGGEYLHVYGNHERYSRTRIRITLTEYPTND
jgi:hypothetical protein